MNQEENKLKFIQKAIDLSIKSIDKGGGPFGAVIAKNGKLISSGHNTVTIDKDPTAHAEINAIRAAARALGTFDLSGCEIYSSCEPCPMCLSSIYWARISKIYYANSQDDAKKIGFDDSYIYKQISLEKDQREIPMKRIAHTQALQAFKAWENKENKTKY